MKTRKIVEIALTCVVIVFAYLIIKEVKRPVEFQKEKDERFKYVIQKLKDIRAAQVVYKAQNNDYTNSFDSLIYFLKNDSVMQITKIGDDEDTVAMMSGNPELWRRDTSYIPIIKTIKTFKEDSSRVFNFVLDSMNSVPFTGGKTFEMETSKIPSLNNTVSVFASYIFVKDVLHGMDEDLVASEVEKKDRLQVGSVVEVNNNAGNWE